MMPDQEYKTRADMIAAGLSLDQQNDLLLEKIARLKMQIDGAKAHCAQTGDYSDADWYNRANYALRMVAKEHQQCIREIGERNKRTKLENAARFERLFVEIARRRLHRELFQEIFNEAQQERDEALGNVA